MHAINAVITAKSGFENEVKATLQAMIKKVENEEETIIYTLHSSSESKGKFFFYELYKNREAIEKHFSTDYFKKLGEDLKNITEGIDVEIFEVVEGITPKL